MDKNSLSAVRYVISCAQVQFAPPHKMVLAKHLHRSKKLD